jgi:hypothetical protein
MKKEIAGYSTRHLKIDKDAATTMRTQCRPPQHPSATRSQKCVEGKKKT